MFTLHGSTGPADHTRALVTPATGWNADRGDGMYQNPVLFADYSDPDAIRVGDDYWLAASSFNHVPGLPILHSYDLVTWTIANHALPRLEPLAHFSVPRHGAGVWAPALRHYAGKFWLFYPDPDFGIYVVTAEDPRGDWTAPRLVKKGKGLIDPCPFWDDDNTGYLIHGWANSRSGIKNRLTLNRLSNDHHGVEDDGEVIIDGDQIEGWHTIEGPKLYKRAGYYYIFAPAGGVREGYQAVFRSRCLRGPYEHRIVLAQGTTPVNGPHQGAWVQTPMGEHWFLHFQERPAFGRVVHLQPMSWCDDWPVMGQLSNRPGIGEPVALWQKPTSAPSRSVDQQNGYVLDPSLPGREWQWQANPQPDWFSVTPNGTTWRLSCVPLPREATLWHAGNLLLQKFMGPAFAVTAVLKLCSPKLNDRAGLVVFGDDYAWLGVRRTRGKTLLGLQVCHAANAGGLETCVDLIEIGDSEVQLRVVVDDSARCRFFFKREGGRFTALGTPFQAKSSLWVGAKVGVFAAGTLSEATENHGHAEISRFELESLERV